MGKITRFEIKKTQREAFTNTATQARELANAIADNEENVLGPSDTALCEAALRAYAAQVEAGFALVAPPIGDETKT